MTKAQSQRGEISPNKVAIYARRATDDRSDMTTLETQLQGCKKFILAQGWQVNESLIFIDDGFRGGTLNRPAITKLREAVKEGLVDCVVVFQLNRLSKSAIDLVNLINEWGNGIHLKCVNEPIDTMTILERSFL
jgi:site-specific DNA recombinase